MAAGFFCIIIIVHFCNELFIISRIHIPGLGEFHLCDELEFSFNIPIDEMFIIPAIAIDDIVDRLRENVVIATNTKLLRVDSSLFCKFVTFHQFREESAKENKPPVSDDEMNEEAK